MVDLNMNYVNMNDLISELQENGLNIKQGTKLFKNIEGKSKQVFWHFGYLSYEESNLIKTTFKNRDINIQHLKNLIESVSISGAPLPVVIVIDKHGNMILIDGQHTVIVCKILGYEIPITYTYIEDINHIKIDELLVMLNVNQRKWNFQDYKKYRIKGGDRFFKIFDTIQKRLKGSGLPSNSLASLMLGQNVDIHKIKVYGIEYYNIDFNRNLFLYRINSLISFLYKVSDIYNVKSHKFMEGLSKFIIENDVDDIIEIFNSFVGFLEETKESFECAPQETKEWKDYFEFKFEDFIKN